MHRVQNVTPVPFSNCESYSWHQMNRKRRQVWGDTVGFFDVFIEHPPYFTLKLLGATVTDAVQIERMKKNIFSNVKEFNLKSLYLNYTANYMVPWEENRKRMLLISLWRRSLHLSTREKSQRFASLGELQPFGSPCKASVWYMAFLPCCTWHWQPLNPLPPLLIILHCNCLLLFSIYILLISQERKVIPRAFSISASLFFVEIPGAAFDVNQKCADMSFPGIYWARRKTSVEFYVFWIRLMLLKFHPEK